jgi:hypothetical protein
VQGLTLYAVYRYVLKVKWKEGSRFAERMNIINEKGETAILFFMVFWNPPAITRITSQFESAVVMFLYNGSLITS